MERDVSVDNSRAIRAKTDDAARERFLSEERTHILRLTGRILGRAVTDSDDEWSIALMATSEALGSYDVSRGSFWSYAAIVIRSRLNDWYRSPASGRSEELMVAPDTFSGELTDSEDGTNALRREVAEQTSVSVDTGLRDEIEALTQELAPYGIDFFALAEVSPKTAKTRTACGEVLAAMRTPPPLIPLLRERKLLPIRELGQRIRVSRKLIDRHRRYLIAASLILSGDYPGLAEYMP